MSQNDEYLIDQRGIAPPKEAALYAHSTGATLAVWRHQGRGPRFIKRGHRIFYSFAEIDRWLRAQPAYSSTAEYNSTGKPSASTPAQSRPASGNVAPAKIGAPQKSTSGKAA
jgi:hypothetical protein